MFLHASESAGPICGMTNSPLEVGHWPGPAAQSVDLAAEVRTETASSRSSPFMVVPALKNPLLTLVRPVIQSGIL